jgi:hypothetical protein
MCNIRDCSEALQKPGSPLKECQLMLDILIGKVQGDHGCCGTLFEKCNLGLKYLSPKNGLSTNPDFEAGIAKIQSGSEQTMMRTEKCACRAFQKDANLESDDKSDLTVDSGREDFFLREFEKAKKQKTKESSSQSDYIDCNFITGSAAVVKSLWSMYDAFNSKRRRGTSLVSLLSRLKCNNYLK